jgi:hypothetical protein
VIAREYPGPLTKLFAYGGAAAISAARVTGRQHFASDALIGSAIGWYVGRQVYNAHNEHDNPDSRYGTFQRTSGDRGPRDPAYMGSPYVPLDSWVYPAINRLAAMGYIDSAFLGMRPWTRMGCARLVEEAGGKLVTQGVSDGNAEQLYNSLRAEFAEENLRWNGARNVGARIESVYTRITEIQGKPLTDGYHFAQTIVNDFGRPYGEGFNAVTGISSYAVAGPLAFYVQGEYQHAPEVPADPLVVRTAIAAVDLLPVAPGTPHADVNRFTLLDAYAAFHIAGWQISVGKQNLWWGPGTDTALLFTNNAEPITMVRISQSVPTVFPGLGKFLGPVRSEVFIGRLEGHQFVFAPPDYVNLIGSYATLLDPQPYIHGEKFSLKPTENLEIGVGLTAVFGGPGVPVTTQNFLRTFNTTQNFSNNYSTGRYNNGDRRTGFQFSYRVPGLRRWLTLYNDSIAEDEPNPIAYPRRSAMNPGLYLSHVPHLARLDFRVESAYTDLPNLRLQGIFYHDVRFANSYTNNGNIMGSWVGRQSRAVQASSSYWFSAKNKVMVGYRRQDVSEGFLPAGGTLNDVSATANWMATHEMEIRASMQVESWTFPVLAPTRRNNVSASVQVTFHPKWRLN